MTGSGMRIWPHASQFRVKENLFEVLWKFVLGSLERNIRDKTFFVPGHYYNQKCCTHLLRPQQWCPAQRRSELHECVQAEMGTLPCALALALVFNSKVCGLKSSLALSVSLQTHVSSKIWKSDQVDGHSNPCENQSSWKFYHNSTKFYIAIICTTGILSKELINIRVTRISLIIINLLTILTIPMIFSTELQNNFQKRNEWRKAIISVVKKKVKKLKTYWRSLLGK